MNIEQSKPIISGPQTNTVVQSDCVEVMRRFRSCSVDFVLTDPPYLAHYRSRESNGEQAEAGGAKGILPHVPASRGVNNHGDGTLFDRTEFTYQPKSDTFRCPAGQTLARKQLSRKDRMVYYAGQPEVCGSCG